MSNEKRLMTSEELAEVMNNVNTARVEILLHAGIGPDEIPNEEMRGIISCPICGDDFYYIISAFNGHITGVCSKKDCLRWRE
jgi:hypothetical protein